MADQNIGFYQYLEAAFRYRLFNSVGQTAKLETNFDYLGYHLPYKRIFYYARKLLPKFYVSEFPDTEEGNLQMARKVLEKLDKHMDAELDRYFNPSTIPQENAPVVSEAQREVLLPKEQEVEKAQEVKPVDQVITSKPKLKINLGFAKNFGSGAGIFFQRNAGKYLTTGRVASGVSILIGGFTGAGLTGGNPIGILAGAGLGAITPSWVGNGNAAKFLGKAGNGALDSIQNLSNHVSNRGRGGLIKSGKGKWKLVLAGVLIWTVVIGGIAALAPNPLPGQQPTANAATIGNGLDYTLPVKNPTVVPLDIKNQVISAFPKAKIEYWEQIVKVSIDNGFNPALALALWIEETGASQTTLVANGGGGIPNERGEFSTGHLGCAPGEDQKIEESLSCLFKFVVKNNFTDEQFPQFMAKYSGGPVDTPFSNNPNFPGNIKTWYSKLVPAGVGAIKQISTPTVSAIASCPVPNGAISTPSYQGGRDSGKNNGHCDGGYGYTCHCGTSGRRAKAIDVPTNGQSVRLPKINYQDVDWRLIVGPYSVDSEEGGGMGYTFQASLGSDTYYLDMLHLNQASLSNGVDYPSNTPLATSVIGHVHMTIGKNLSKSPVAGSDTDCDPGWLPSDFMCK